MDVARFEQRVRAMEGFGHRGSATTFECRAAEYLAGELRASGIDVAVEPFRGARSLPARMLIHIILAAIGAALLCRSPVLTVILGGLSLVSFLIEQTFCIALLSWPVCRYRSQNVCGKISARQPPRKRLVLCAHYDTQHSGIVWTINRYFMRLGYRSPLLLKPPMTPVIGLMAGQIALGVSRLAMHSTLQITILNAILLAIYAILAALFIQWALGRPVPGAADNASGVAAVLELADEWRKFPPEDDVELTILLPGCEESGMLGAAAWATRHRSELRALATIFINIDGIGFGPPRFLGAEVPVAGLPIHSDHQIIRLCEQAANECGVRDAGPHSLPGPTDGLAFLARGIRGITIVGFHDGGVLPDYHTLNDRSENMDFAAARAGVAFCSLVCRALVEAGDQAKS
jgi:hypothetical protein